MKRKYEVTLKDKSKLYILAEKVSGKNCLFIFLGGKKHYICGIDKKFDENFTISDLKKGEKIYYRGEEINDLSKTMRQIYINKNKNIIPVNRFPDEYIAQRKFYVETNDKNLHQIIMMKRGRNHIDIYLLDEHDKLKKRKIISAETSQGPISYEADFEFKKMPFNTGDVLIYRKGTAWLGSKHKLQEITDVTEVPRFDEVEYSLKKLKEAA
ncbi:hypothetical protein HQ545_00510 [Candidatus Woesearchaeota archaeon]|nr:hypothetical protein [Candidatus Woesearchaeota archaeon]